MLLAIKRGKVLTYLKHKTDITFLPETHFVKEEALEQNWVGHIFRRSYSTKRNGIIILVNGSLSFTLLKEVKDDEGRTMMIFMLQIRVIQEVNRRRARLYQVDISIKFQIPFWTGTNLVVQ